MYLLSILNGVQVMASSCTNIFKETSLSPTLENLTRVIWRFSLQIRELISTFSTFLCSREFSNIANVSFCECGTPMNNNVI